MHRHLVPCAALAAVALTSGCAGTAPAGSSTNTTAASSSAVTAPGRAQAGVQAHCAAWDSQIVGPYKYENNVWGIDKARGFKPDQCLLTRTVDGRREIGWTWDWPGMDRTVFAYPQIMWGWKPWSGGAPSDKRFPMRVGDLKRLVMDYQVETEAAGTYNLAPEVWLTSSGAWSDRPNPRIITTEIMFWMDYQQGATPAGSIVDRPIIGGVNYELWKMDNIGNKGDGKGWTIYSFKSPTIQHSGSIDIRALLTYMVGKGWVSADEYVASVEFGNEVMGGRGTTWVKKFEVTAQ
jgi:hypothetical protein